MPLPVQLTDDDAQQLALALRHERRAQQAAEVAVAEARLPWLKAVEAKQMVLDRLASTYAFEPDQQLQFDPLTRTLAPAPPNGHGGR